MAVDNFFQLLGVGANAIGSLANTGLNLAAALEQNRLREQGVSGLQELGRAAVGVGIGSAVAGRDQMLAASGAANQLRAGGALQFASGYFGLPAGTPGGPAAGRAGTPSGFSALLGQAAGGQTEFTPEQFAQALRQEGAAPQTVPGGDSIAALQSALGQVRLGQGGLSEPTRGRTAKMQQEAAAREQALMAQIGKAVADERARLQVGFDQMRETLDSGYGKIMGTLKEAFDTAYGFAAEGRETSLGMFNTQMGNLMDWSGRLTASAAQSVQAQIAKTVSSMKAGLTGDPRKDAMLNRQIAATESSMMQQGGEIIVGAHTTANTFLAERQSEAINSYRAADLSYVNALTQAQATRAAGESNAWSTYASGSLENQRRYDEGNLSLTGLWSSSLDASTARLGQAGLAAMTADLQALTQDAAVLTGMYSMADQIATTAGLDLQSTVNTFWAGIGAALTNGFALSRDAAAALTGATIRTADMAEFGRTLENSMVTFRTVQLQERQMDLQENQFDFQQAMGYTGLGLSAAGLGVDGLGSLKKKPVSFDINQGINTEGMY